MNPYRPNIYTNEFNAHKRTQDPNEHDYLWSVLLYLALLVIVIGIVGSWFVPN